MPKEFFSPKKPRQLVSDIISSQKPKDDQGPKEPEEQEEIEIQQETITEVQYSHQPQKVLGWRIPRWPFVIFFLIAVLAGLIYLGWEILPKLEIKIFLKKYPQPFDEIVDVSKSFSLNQTYSSSTPIKLPAELFTEHRNLQMSFPATGKQKIENKAQGKITIYNSYSSDPQVLVADTRFLAPDNKIFRLSKSTKVPGAKIQEGKIVPSGIEAAVAADQPGAEYNIGPVTKFTIPGFKGSPKYEGFYAKSDQSMVDGFVGEITVPTDKDIGDAETKIRQVLEDNLKAAVFSQLPKEFRVIDNSSEFEILDEKINKEIDEENKFSVFAEAQIKLVAFREKDLNDALIAKALFQLPEGDYETVDSNIEYGVPRSNFDKGEMSFPAKGQITFQRKISPELFRQQVTGKNEQALKALIYSLPGLEEPKRAEISLWPIYAKKAPKDINKIKIIIQ